MTPIGPQLKALRQRAGLRQVDLAERISVSQPTVSSVENGAPTTTDVVERWVEACGGELLIEGGASAELRALLASMNEGDRELLLRIARSIPSAPAPAKSAMTMAFEQLASRS